MNPSRLMALFLDLGDTTVRIAKPSMRKASNRISIAHDCSISSNELDQGIKSEWRYRRQNYLDSKSQLKVRDRLSELVYLTDFFHCVLSYQLNIPIPDRKVEQWLAYWYSSSLSYTLFPNVLEILQYLRSNGVSIWMISNAFPYAHSIINNTRIHKLLNGIILSYEHEFEKPDKEIFKIALDKAKVNPSNSVLLDDDLGFVYGALEVKMHGFWFNPENKPYPKEFKGNKVSVISNFEELPSYFFQFSPQENNATTKSIISDCREPALL